MADRKTTRKYYFSTEGETECWYLKWLENAINSAVKARYKVSIDCKAQKDPLTRAKSLNIIERVSICHFFDYESNEPHHRQQFIWVLDRMKDANELGKSLTYTAGYSNLTFELWIILHMMNCNKSLAHRDSYLRFINKAFDKKYESLDEFKHKKNFESCLNKMDLSNVISAVNRAEMIMKLHEDDGHKNCSHNGYSYYEDNPSLSSWEAIKKILKDCSLIN